MFFRSKRSHRKRNFRTHHSCPAKPARGEGKKRQLCLEHLENRNLLATTVITVNSLDDDALGQLTGPEMTLRAAIESANANTTSDDILINFDLSDSGPFTIQPGSDLLHDNPLPTITRDDVTIDGFSQDPNNILIYLNGSQTDGHGIVIDASNCRIEGLKIENFAGAGIRIEASDNTVEDNLITGNGVGIEIVGSDDSQYRDHLVVAVPGFSFDLTTLHAGTLADELGVDNSAVSGNKILDNWITTSAQQVVLIAHASQNIVQGLERTKVKYAVVTIAI